MDKKYIPKLVNLACAVIVFTLPIKAIAEAIEILAIGASQTAGRGISINDSYPAQLESMLKSEGYDVKVINAGVSGEKPYEIFNRLKRNEFSERTKIVVFEPGANELNKPSAIEYIELTLQWIKEKHTPCIYMSARRIQSDDEAQDTSNKFGAIYYGYLKKDIPNDSEHVQAGEYFRKKNSVDFHLTAAGYKIIAQGLVPLIKTVISEKQLVSPVAQSAKQ
jgi:acyl-CoA thioesterase I